MSFMNDGSNAKGKFKERKEKVYQRFEKETKKKGVEECGGERKD